MVAVALHEGTRPSNVFTRADIHGDTVLDCDVVIVGSGAGGAPMAAELAEAGFDVIVLEEGSYYTTRDFTANTTAMVRQLYRGGGATMALGNPPILFQEGRAVGGSTVINGGMSWRTPDDILARWRREAGLETSPESLDPYFARVEKRIHVAPMDDAAIGNDNWLLKKGADAKGWKTVGNLRNQVHCVGSNRCAFGCPTGAKQSALVSYLPRALHFGARVYADVRVDRVTFHGKRANGVIGRSAAGHNVVVRAKLVVSACGAIHTPALL
ncbi:MAG TPA: GMC family oxidoreductase N-terminal domain-containing protein, partial [Kofleriaceae bacterium]